MTLRELDRRVSTGKGWVAQVASGVRRPPLRSIDRWADALDLKGSERERFFDLAAIAHVPDPAQSRLVERLTRQGYL